VQRGCATPTSCAAPHNTASNRKNATGKATTQLRKVTFLSGAKSDFSKRF
jgi:hypothetical protein